MSTVAAEKHETLVMFAHVEKLEAIANRVDQSDETSAQELYDLAESVVGQVPPVRIAVAAELLDVTKVTIKSWCQRGILARAESSMTPVQTLDPHRLHEVWHIVRDLREIGSKPGNLAEQIWHRLEDRQVTESEAFLQGVREWQAGDVLDA